MLDVLQHYDLLSGLKPKPDGYRGNCPFHESGSSRSFHVSTTKNVFNCFGCDAGGNVLDFVALSEDVPIPKASQLLASWFNLEPAPPASVARAPEETPETPLPEAMNQPLTFELKGLDPEHPALTEALNIGADTGRHFGVGFHSGKGLVANRLAVPFHNAQGELLAYLGLENGQPPVWPDNFDPYREVYNFHRVAELESDRIVIASSVPAVWRLYEAGVPEALYLPRDLAFPTRAQFAKLLTLSAESVLILEPADHQIGLERMLAAFFFTRRVILEKDPALVSIDELRSIVDS